MFLSDLNIDSECVIACGCSKGGPKGRQKDYGIDRCLVWVHHQAYARMICILLPLQEKLGRLLHGVNLGEALIGLARAAAHLGLPQVADTALNHLQSTELPLQRQVPVYRLPQP